MKINITINNRKYTVEKNITIEKLLCSLEIRITAGMAIAINNSIVKKNEWSNFKLENNSKVLIISAARGG